MPEYVFDLRDPEPPEPWTLEQINAFPTGHEAGKRILACATDVYERVRCAVEASPLAAYYRVIEQPALADGQVLSIDPALLEPPRFEFEFAMPDYRCGSCAAKVPMPGLCGICASMAGLLFGARASILPAIITVLGT